MLGLAAGAFAVVAMALPAWSDDDGHHRRDETFKVKAVIQVPGNPLFSFDISWTDEALDKYFLADRNNKTIDVVDPRTFAITQFPNPAYAGFTGNNDTSGPDGVLTANNSTELWVGDSPGRVWVLDSHTGAIKTLPGGATNPISVGGTTRADEVCVDPVDHLLMVQSPGESPPYVTFISTTTYKPVGKIVFDGGPGNGPKATNGLEQCQWNPRTKKFLINVPEINGAGNDTSPGGIAVMDPHTMKFETTFMIPIADCAGPQGMAIGPDGQILEGCNAKSPDGHRNTVVVNDSGHVLKTFVDLGGDDEVWYNPDDGHYSIPSCNTACRTVGGGGVEILGIIDADSLRVDQLVTVARQNGDTTVTTGNPRTIHSAAAIENMIILPIPAGPGGNVPHFDPTLCDTLGGDGITIVGNPSTATGCIVVLAARHDDRGEQVVEERRGDDHER
jgi:hypothetical protein